jgi:DNA-binding NtrC family response regulator
MASSGGPESEMPEPPSAKSLEEAKKRHVQHILQEVRFDLDEAARLLDIEMSELRALMGKLGIQSPPGA